MHVLQLHATISLPPGSAGAKSLKSRFENMAKEQEDDTKKRLEEERARRQAKDKKDREESEKLAKVKHATLYSIRDRYWYSI